MTVNPAAHHAHCMSRPAEAQDVAPRSTAAITNSPVRTHSPIATPCGIEHLDFSPQCQLAFLDNGFRCARPAAAYVEFHMVGYCKRDDCDEDGNACGFACADHLDALEYTAECTARELPPATLARRLSRRVARCPSCDRPIRSAADILQVVVML